MRKKIIVQSKNDLKGKGKRESDEAIINQIAMDNNIPIRFVTGQPKSGLSSKEDVIKFIEHFSPAEINRRKQARLRARRDLAGRRMGFKNWDNFGSVISEKLLELEAENATERQVNGAIKFIMFRAMKAIPEGKSKTIDTELLELTKTAPRLRKNW